MVDQPCVTGQSSAAWLADYDRGAVEREIRERDEKARAFRWYHLMRRTILDHHAEKHVLRCLADHAQAGPDLDDHGRIDGECVLLMRTICLETGLPRRTVERATAGLVEKDVITRETRGRRGGGRGANRYRILPRNPFERENKHARVAGLNTPGWRSIGKAG